MFEIMSRDEAIARGLKFFFTGRPCKYGHEAPRYTNGRVCYECNRVNSKNWQHRHAEKVVAKRAANQEKNPDYFRIYYQRNAEKRKRQAKDWYEANKERALKSCQAWTERNREKSREMGRMSARKRRARKARVGGSHTRADLERIYRNQRGKCAVCKCSLARARREVDHIIPISRGGDNNPANLQYLCRPCNRAKSAKDPIEFAQERGLLL